ncbi:MAG: Rv3235 family protein [Candidatus Nanopelagicales bacterium]|nr:Rv3235 family protein [Candidatus Nanopelagicales bacterium]
MDDIDDFSERRATPTRELPEPVAWSARLAQAIVEARSGIRSPQQLSRWTTRAILTDLRAAHRSVREREAIQVRVRSVHASQPADGVVEATAVVSWGTRHRALALRMEGWDGKWICVSADLV